MRLLLPLLALSLPACVKEKPAEETDDSGAAAGCPVALVSPASLAWADLVVGEPAPLALSVVNNCVGEGTLSVVAEVEAGGAFTVTGSPASLAPGEVTTLEVTLTPVGYDDVTSTLLLTTNDPAASTVAVPLSATIDADLDGDGYDTVDAGGEDCDDADATVNPAAAEAWYDGVDQDCDGASDYDADGDGADALDHGGADCDDADPTFHPGATEIWYDDLDQDCDGASDHDADRDGFDAPSGGGEDCDDTVATSFPGAEEIWYDSLDGACDGGSDYDADGDGFDTSAYGGDDCDDASATIHPDATETWYDGVDTDCDGASDYDADADGHDADTFGGDDCDDADGTVSPTAAESWYDGVDADCDGASDYDADGDGFDAEPYGGADCNDLSATVNPGASDAWYDGLDQDCDGASDYDADGDGHDVDTHGGDDCDDDLPAIHGGATEVWYDGIDADCDGASDYDADGDGADSDARGGDDCDDTDDAVFVGASEAWYDGIDGDCDGGSDYDADGDGISAFPWGEDCDDEDATRTEGTEETRNGVDDDCDGLVDEGFAEAGDIVISEVMPNPNAVSDTVGEWFELYNATDLDVDMTGWIVYSDDGGYFVVGSGLVVPAGGYAVLGVEDDATRNGGVPVDYQYDRTTFGLGDSGDSIYLVAGSTTVAELSWDTMGWPATVGISLELDDDHLLPADASTSRYWCSANDPYGSGDKGTPGAGNGNCSSLDDDGDGSITTDCDDDDASIEPGLTETPDGVDQNCNGFVDEAHVPLRSSRWFSGDADYDYLTLLGIADFDGDGSLDLASVDQSGGGVSFVDGADYGTWAGPVSLYDDASFTPVSSTSFRGGPIEMGDVTGDGLVDIVYSVHTGSFPTGFAVFAAPFTGATTGRAPTAIFSNSESYSGGEPVDASHDFDGDGIDDVVYANAYAGAASSGYGYSGIVAVVEGAALSGTLDWGDATVRLLGSSVQGCGYGTKAGDFDADGYADLAVSCYGYPYTTYVWLGDGLASTGDLTLSSVAPARIEGGYYYTLDAHDVDDDGADDLATDNYGTGVRWFLGIGAASGVLAPGDADVYVSDAYLARARYDGDGDGHEEPGIYRWSSGNANALSFYPPSAFEDGALAASEASWAATIAGYPTAASSADLDDDGDTEIVAWSTSWYASTYESKGGVQIIEP